jgi:hypothetical protein
VKHLESKKHLSFGSLVGFLSNLYLKIKDRRDPTKTGYSIRDTAMSGLAMMHFQSGSLLQFQRQLREKDGRIIYRLCLA